MPSESNTREIDAEALCQKVAEVLATCDGKTIADIANRVLFTPVTYVGDSIFTIEDV